MAEDTTPPTFLNRHPIISMVLLTLLFLSVFLALTAIPVALYTYSQVRSFTTAAHTTPRELYQTIKTGWHQTPTQTNHHKNILLLGVDSLETRGNAPPLTDTILLVSVNLESGEIRSLPLPRDIWSEEYQTKINALYAYGLERSPQHPDAFPTQVIQDLTGVPIHHTIVLSLDQVAEIIDRLGGIDVTVETGFIDPQFPRSDVDITTERDPTKLYETVEFQTGPQHMDGSTALKYIRSRHSTGEEGDDTARSRRQQQVITALLTRATQPELLRQPAHVGELYYFYTQNFASAFSLTEGIATVKTLLPHRNQIKYQGSSLSIFPEDKNGVLVNPPLSRQYQNQWIYLVRDSVTFQKETQIKLGLTTS